MTKLHFVGFNGYQQCPENENKVIRDWVCVENKEIVDIFCTHRFTVIDTPSFVKLNGIVNVDCNEKCQIIKKPENIRVLGSCTEFLIATENINIWKLCYKKFKWEKLNLNFIKEEEKPIWEEKGNEIVKLSFLEKDVILLLNNGSVWRLFQTNKLHIIFTYDIEKAIDIASGFEHTLILTESGCVLSFGNGSRGQLGHGDLDSVDEPLQISALESLKIIKINVGGWHSCAITDSGDMCTWGWNSFGQLSAFNKTKEIGLATLPVFVDVGTECETKVVDVTCGSRHTVAKLANGEVYSSGCNNYCQLGVGSAAEKISKFTKSKIRTSQNGKLKCGNWYTILMEKESEV